MVNEVYGRRNRATTPWLTALPLPGCDLLELPLRSSTLASGFCAYTFSPSAVAAGLVAIVEERPRHGTNKTAYRTFL